MSISNISHRDIGYCEFSARLDNVVSVARLLRDYCQARLIDESLWPQVELAFCEALNNAVEHGCNENPDLLVKAQWCWTEDSLDIEVNDPGNFDDSNITTALPDDPLSESGRGYYILESIANEVIHQKTEYGHKLSLKFILHQQQSCLDSMQELYESLQVMTHDLGIGYSKIEALQGFANDISNNPLLEEIIQTGIGRMRALHNIPRIGVWIASQDGLENIYHEANSKLTSKEAKIPFGSDNALIKAFDKQAMEFIRNCGTLAAENPLCNQDRCALISPIIYQGESLGAVAVSSPFEDRELMENHLSGLLQVFSQFLGIAYASTNAFKQKEEDEKERTQLEIASEIQRSLLPSQYPKNLHCRMTGKTEAAMAVGGDYIDAIEIRDVGLLIVIADVMGKGVPAALLATIFRTAIRSRLNLAETPGWLLSKINKQIHKELGHLNMFITAQAAFYTYDKKMLKLASAGHCPALLLKSDSNDVQDLTAEGLPLGIDPDDIYEERLINLDTGDKTLFLTDGIYEAENSDGMMLGIEQFSKQVPRFWRDGLEDVTGKAFDFVSDYSRGALALDDRTIMALEIL